MLAAYARSLYIPPSADQTFCCGSAPPGYGMCHAIAMQIWGGGARQRPAVGYSLPYSARGSKYIRATASRARGRPARATAHVRGVRALCSARRAMRGGWACRMPYVCARWSGSGTTSYDIANAPDRWVGGRAGAPYPRAARVDGELVHGYRWILTDRAGGRRWARRRVLAGWRGAHT